MTRIWNFSAGPGTMPEAVLHQAAEEMLDYRGTGMSVMEMSHRSDAFLEIQAEAEAALRTLLDVPEHMNVLFLQGGASLQFAMIPLNLLGDNDFGAYVESGVWSQKAVAEAQRVGRATVIASGEEHGFRQLPELRPGDIPEQTRYVHLTSNNTIMGTQYSAFPNVEPARLVVDMSSDFLSRPLNMKDFGLIYAGAQKNAGPAGLTIAILDEAVLDQPEDYVPTMLRYDTHIRANSRYNTPPTYAIYLAKLVFAWCAQQGGLAAIGERNQAKAKLLYDTLDASSFYQALIDPPDRSRMNVTFRLQKEALEPRFIAAAAAAGLVNLKGHRAAGGLRASLYNAMPLAGVEALVSFMQDFEKRYG